MLLLTLSIMIGSYRRVIGLRLIEVSFSGVDNAEHIVVIDEEYGFVDKFFCHFR